MYNQEQWLTVEQVAQQLQVSTETIRRAIRQGRLKAVKFKGWRINPKALQDFLSGRESGEENKGAASQETPGRLTPALV